MRNINRLRNLPIIFAFICLKRDVSWRKNENFLADGPDIAFNGVSWAADKIHNALCFSFGGFFKIHNDGNFIAQTIRNSLRVVDTFRLDSFNFGLRVVEIAAVFFIFIYDNSPPKLI